MKGKGVRKDMKQAIEWFGRAAEQGYIEAQFTLGLSYLRGKGVEKNWDMAYDLFSKVAKRGHQKSMRFMRIMSK